MRAASCAAWRDAFFSRCRSRPPPPARRGTNCLGVRRSVLTLGGNRHWAHEVEVVVGLIWRLVAQPLLFGIIGSLLGFETLDVATLPMSLALVVCGALCCSQSSAA